MMKKLRGRLFDLYYHFDDRRAVEVAEVVVEIDQAAPQLLHHPLDQLPPIGRVLRERRPSLGGVGELQHVARHGLVPPYLREEHRRRRLKRASRAATPAHISARSRSVNPGAKARG